MSTKRPSTAVWEPNRDVWVEVRATCCGYNQSLVEAMEQLDATPAQILQAVIFQAFLSSAEGNAMAYTLRKNCPQLASARLV